MEVSLLQHKAHKVMVKNNLKLRVKRPWKTYSLILNQKQLKKKSTNVNKILGHIKSSNDLNINR